MALTATSSLPQPKRQKIGIACDLCRTRKSKCDGARPVCGPCLKRRNGREQCAYRESNRRSQSPVPLSGREGGSECRSQRVLDHDLTDTAAFTSSSAGPSSHPITLEQPQPYPVDQPRVQHSSSRVSRRASESTDAMGAVDSWALDAGLLGASSSANFMRQMRKAVDGRDSPGLGVRGAVSTHVTHVTNRLHQRVHEWKKNLHGPEYVLPPRHTADGLMNIYWQYAWPIFPFLDEHQVSECYESLWTGGTMQSFDQRVFHCILNVAFAIACKIDPEALPGTQEYSSSVYFTRARSLLICDLLDISDFHLVQALLLMSQFLQSTSMPRQCFQTVGMAIWIAQDLGLHLPQTALAIEDHRHRELVQRVWQGCILMDRIMAMTFGRPMRLSQDVLSSVHSTSSNTIPTEPSKLKFFQEYYALHIILGDILASFYTRSRDKDGSSDTQGLHLDELTKFEERLASWELNVVPYLKPSASSSGSTVEASPNGHIFERQANVLHARLLHTRLLLWRPFFSKTLASDAHEQSLSSQIAQCMTMHCQTNSVKTAQQLITLVHEGVENERSTSISYWYNIYYVFNAAIVLITARTFPSLLQAIPLTAVSGSVEQAFYCLQTYESYTAAARRCRVALEVLQNKVTANGKVAWSESPLAQDSVPQSRSFENDFDFSNWATGSENELWTLFDGMDLFWLDNALSEQMTDVGGRV